MPRIPWAQVRLTNVQIKFQVHVVLNKQLTHVILEEATRSPALRGDHGEHRLHTIVLCALSFTRVRILPSISAFMQECLELCPAYTSVCF